MKRVGGGMKARGAATPVRLLSRKLVRAFLSAALSSSLLLVGCFEEEAGEQFYGKVAVPRSREFRWSDGGLPRVFDPARAAAPPDTDAVRALYEGLTDYEPSTLRPVPAVASRWEASEGGRVWTFHLREDARWSNGDAVTSEDFVRSWRRTLALGERAPHLKLLSNIEGARRSPLLSATPETTEPPRAAPQKTVEFGAVALDSRTLRVTLQRPDRNFPALVAHPVFRPVHELSALPEPEELEGAPPPPGGEADFGFLTNGAFNLARLDAESVVLERAKNYWDAASVQLERVRFVGKRTAEDALAAYRAGEIDAVTNVPFEPLAVKLLTPYKDFRRETFGALNFYAFNTARPPFDDRRVREALASAVDIERLSADTLGGSTEPARTYLPDTPEAEPSVPPAPSPDARGAKNAQKPEAEDDEGEAVQSPVGHDVERARRLLAEAGFPGGASFPRVRLLVNRNEQQRLVASAVARMWRDALGVETEVMVRGWEEYEAMLRAGDYDVARRSIVMQTTDEESNMLALFGEEPTPGAAAPTPQPSPAPDSSPSPEQTDADGVEVTAAAGSPLILTSAQAVEELPAIPLYFASSYALVKPYVEGFDSNLLDAPSLKRARINTGWQPPPRPKRGGLLMASP
ncbi:MAG TPA: peptide ABC transporter substrate-binding protein [Pyrinomonadaceae bacterium]|nr:peptide ABC transporter substrate-binding protein [Pyrinomonadaceae bacterium]